MIFQLSIKRLFTILFLFNAFILIANDESIYPIVLEKKIEIPGELYKVPDKKIISIKNNWLDKTATLSIIDSSLNKKSLILNNTDIKDFYTNYFTIAAIAISNNRAFLTTFNENYTIKKIHLVDTNTYLDDKYKIRYCHSEKYIISKNNDLYYYDTQKRLKQIISNRYIENSFLSIDSNRFFYLRSSGNITYLIENLNHKFEKELLRIEPANDYTISFKSNNYVIECHYESNSHIFIYSQKLELIREFWINVSRENYVLKVLDNKEIGIYVLSYNDEYHSIKRIDFETNTLSSLDLPKYIISPLALKSDNNTITALFQNAVYNLDDDLNIIFYYAVSIPSNELTKKIVLLNKENYLAIGSNKTRIYEKSENTFWQVNYYYRKVIAYIIPIILFILLSVTYFIYSKKKELNETLLELSENDFIFVFNRKGDLININKTAMKIIEIDSSVPLGRFFKYYCISDHTGELFEIFEKMKNLKESFQQKIHIYKNNELHEYICNAVTKRRATGSVVGYLISGTDITEELRQQKMNNFAQLAHDMQTNLSTLKLNAEELEAEDENSQIKKSKIIKQVNILNQKVRDIVTVGRSSSVHKAKQSSKAIILDVMDEFDFEYYPNIKFIDESKDFELYVDKQKLSRAIRNATENSLKSMKDLDAGILTLRAYKNSKYAYFEVQDIGKGMNKEVKENMLKPYFTSAGGTGLGTMIMLNAIEQHGGEITVESEEGIGTKITFKIPLS